MTLLSVYQILASWKRLDIFESAALDTLITTLQSSKSELSKMPSSTRTVFSKQDVMRRMEEDRERHKRLRERAWILPSKSFYDSLPAFNPSSAKNLRVTQIAGQVNPKESAKDKEAVDALEVEFNHVWDNLSDLGQDDMDMIRENNGKWWGHQGIEEKPKITLNTTEKDASSDSPTKRKADVVDAINQDDPRHRPNTHSDRPHAYEPHNKNLYQRPMSQARPPRWAQSNTWH
jgi:CTD kinase subunit gamma